MKLSIITATFNSEKTLASTFNSILKQTHVSFEYIVVDGASTDQTVTIIKSFEEAFKSKEIAFKWISEKDNGIYDAWNKGLKLSTGEWVSFLGSDDVYLDNALTSYSEFISQQEKEIDLVHSNVNIINDNGDLLRKVNGKWSWKVFRRKMNIAHVGAFHNMKYFKKYGTFNTDYKIAGDYELLLRAGKKLRTAKLDSVTVLMGYGGISNDQIFKVFSESIKAKHETGRVNILLCYVDFLKEYLIYMIKKIFY
ncbi:MAG: glycosyltransferase [Algicola sp.]|nr:glycosyltransferase [Algicola sp.]